MPPKILCIVGPTAVGKTRLGVELALELGGEVISADSMQVYRRMDIGTAKPTWEEMRGVPHHMIDVAEPWEDFSVARYVELAAPIAEEIAARGRVPIVVGGTGLYVDSLIHGRTFAVRSTGWRERLQRRVREEGIAPLLTELRAVDPQSAARLHPADEKRILRALEVYYETGMTITRHNEESCTLPPRFACVRVGIAFDDRRELWARIARRVDEMMERGLAGEVERLLEEGVSPGCTAMQAIGYKELAAALQSGGDLAAAAEEVKLRTRQYAKRQVTWFRRKTEDWYLWRGEPDFDSARRFATEKWRAAGIG